MSSQQENLPENAPILSAGSKTVIKGSYGGLLVMVFARAILFACYRSIRCKQECMYYQRVSALDGEM
jgi:hypothetical protein